MDTLLTSWPYLIAYFVIFIPLKILMEKQELEKRNTLSIVKLCNSYEVHEEDYEREKTLAEYAGELKKDLQRIHFRMKEAEQLYSMRAGFILFFHFIFPVIFFLRGCQMIATVVYFFVALFFSDFLVSLFFKRGLSNSSDEEKQILQFDRIDDAFHYYSSKSEEIRYRENAIETYITSLTENDYFIWGMSFLILSLSLSKLL